MEYRQVLTGRNLLLNTQTPHIVQEGNTTKFRNQP